MKKLFVTAICILCSHWLLADEIWISPKGSDFNDGTRQFPKATLTSALRQAREWRRTEDNRIQGGITIYMEVERMPSMNLFLSVRKIAEPRNRPQSFVR